MQSSAPVVWLGGYESFPHPDAEVLKNQYTGSKALARNCRFFLIERPAHQPAAAAPPDCPSAVLTKHCYNRTRGDLSTAAASPGVGRVMESDFRLQGLFE
jgi:hypothetical protein